MIDKQGMATRDPTEDVGKRSLCPSNAGARDSKNEPADEQSFHLHFNRGDLSFRISVKGWVAIGPYMASNTVLLVVAP